MENYRTIYKQNFGLIPKDETGRKYEIHHINGNSNDNDLNNLKAVSIQEHYDIHYNQGDYAACLLIAERLNKSPEELSELARKSVNKRIEDGTYHMLKQNGGSEIAREQALKRSSEGTHNFQGENNPVYKLLENGNHPFVGGELQKKLLVEGRHNSQNPESIEKMKLSQRERVTNKTNNLLGDGTFQREAQLKLIKEGMHHSQKEHTCTYCNKTGRGNRFKSVHFDKCKMKLPEECL
jgi:hypothetical protein